MPASDSHDRYLPDDLSYQDWVTYVFDHPVHVSHTDLFFNAMDCREWSPSAQPRALAYLTRLFREPAGLIGRFSRAQIDQGLDYLVDPLFSEHMSVLVNTALPLEDRCACIDAMAVLYRDLMAPVYGDDTECGGRGGKEPERPNFSCFMWWDVISLVGGPDLPDREAITDAVFRVFEATLTLKSEACLESVLHGLGHWHLHNPERVSATVHRFLAERTDISPELRRYAENAAWGGVR